ncbi:MAG TPA: hypothetical protein VGO47_05750 [Chlamydiales bacterium]|nr:hypothetical protein [Chlamydiales bacterium]
MSEESSGPVSPARFATAAELAEHRRIDHAGESQSDEKLFRCALEGCGKGWKVSLLFHSISTLSRVTFSFQNINGIQYHLQMFVITDLCICICSSYCSSKSHFQDALGRHDKSSEPQSSPATRETTSAYTDPNHSHNGESQVLLLHTTGVTYGAHDISALVHHPDNSQSPAFRMRGQIFHRASITDSMATNQSSAESDASLSNEASHKRPYKRRPPKHIPCPHVGCHKFYKQRTGLQYHLAHVRVH